MAIITMGISTTAPMYLRNMRQGEVDRYTQQLETGFFGLRAKLGRQKTSCRLNFDTSGLNNFVPPSQLVEMNNNPERLECCDSEIRAAGISSGCAYGMQIGKLIAQSVSDTAQKSKIERNRSLRLLEQEGTQESRVVEIAVNSSFFELDSGF